MISLHFKLLFIVYSPVAQLVERVAVNHVVRGSNPLGGAINKKAHFLWVFLLMASVSKDSKPNCADEQEEKASGRKQFGRSGASSASVRPSPRGIRRRKTESERNYGRRSTEPSRGRQVFFIDSYWDSCYKVQYTQITKLSFKLQE